MNYLKDKICPICNKSVTNSEYLNEIFIDKPKANYLAHLITHYRHNHIQYWNKSWGYNGANYRQRWFNDYDEEKKKVNERAKRQLIRKGYKIFKECGIEPSDFLILKNTDEKTIEIASKFLEKNDDSALVVTKKRTLAKRKYNKNERNII